MPSKPTSGTDIFQCQQCGECCKGYGGTYVGRENIRSIAAYVGSSPDRFRQSHCSRSGSRYVLSQGKDGYCAFWKKGLCGIHPVKPKMCRDWPFIRSVLVDAGNWFAMARSCPGMRTDITENDVRRCVRKEMKKDGRL